MRRYFLHFRDGGDLVDDPDGSLLASFDAAMVEATAGARLIMSDQLRAGHGVTLNRQFEIADEFGRILGVLRFGDALKPDGAATI